MSNVGANVARCETVFLVSDSVGGTVRGLVCVPTQHFQATIGESSLSRHLHTRIAASVCDTSDREQAKNEQRRSQRSTLRNSLPGIGFRWGHCQVLFVSQHNTFKQPSANPVSHDTCTRELPPAFVTRATEQAKNEQRRSQRSTLRNSLPGIGFHWGHCQVLFVSQSQHFQATIGESSLSRHLHTRIAASVCDTSDRAGEK